MSAKVIRFPVERRYLERKASPAQLLLYAWATVVFTFGFAVWWWSPHK